MQLDLMRCTWRPLGHPVTTLYGPASCHFNQLVWPLNTNSDKAQRTLWHRCWFTWMQEEIIKIVLWSGKTHSLGNLLKRNSVCKSIVNVEEQVWCRELDFQAAVQGAGWALGRNPGRQEALNCQALGSQRAQRSPGTVGSWTDCRSQGLGRSSETFAQMGAPRGTSSGWFCVTVLWINGFVTLNIWNCWGKLALTVSVDV